MIATKFEEFRHRLAKQFPDENFAAILLQLKKVKIS